MVRRLISANTPNTDNKVDAPIARETRHRQFLANQLPDFMSDFCTLKPE